jgi:hypothetical protein
VYTSQGIESIDAIFLPSRFHERGGCERVSPLPLAHRMLHVATSRRHARPDVLLDNLISLQAENFHSAHFLRHSYLTKSNGCNMFALLVQHHVVGDAQYNKSFAKRAYDQAHPGVIYMPADGTVVPSSYMGAPPKYGPLTLPAGDNK